MQDAFVKNWARDPHLTPGILESTRELNHRFLDLVALKPDGWNAPRWDGIAPLTAPQKAAVADCPYALFDLRFHDDAHWRTRLAPGATWGVSDAAPGDENVRNFVRLALFFAWHVASTTRPAAQLLLGMNEATAEAFRGATIDRMLILAAAEAVNLTARWDDCPRYWSALTGAAARPDSPGLRRIQLYGLQLAAAARLRAEARAV
jgi:hypothetical protein